MFSLTMHSTHFIYCYTTSAVAAMHNVTLGLVFTGNFKTYLNLCVTYVH